MTKRIGLLGLAFITALITARPSTAILTDDDLGLPDEYSRRRHSGPITAQGNCVYRGLLLELDCQQGLGCKTVGTKDLLGKPISYPENLCPPLVAYTRGRILYCLDPPPEQCSPPPEEKCKEQPNISIDCLCC